MKSARATGAGDGRRGWAGRRNESLLWHREVKKDKSGGEIDRNLLTRRNKFLWLTRISCMVLHFWRDEQQRRRSQPTATYHTHKARVHLIPNRDFHCLLSNMFGRPAFECSGCGCRFWCDAHCKRYASKRLSLVFGRFAQRRTQHSIFNIYFIQFYLQHLSSH